MSRLSPGIAIFALSVIPAFAQVRVAVLGSGQAPIEQILKAPEFAVTRLASSDSVNASLYDCLVLFHTRNFSSEAKQNFLRYLKDGGDLVLIGPGGFTQTDSMVLPAFSKYEPYHLKDVVSVRTYGDQNLLKAGEVKGQFEGLSALGFTRTVAKYTPLLSAVDAHGRVKGWAAGILTHFAEYPGSNWLLFGISNPEFYRTSVFAKTLTTMLVEMKSGALERSAAAETSKRLASQIKLASPAPAGFLRLSPDRRHIVCPDGRRFFMIGANYTRPLDAALSKSFDDSSVDDDFRKARDAGVNCLRVGFAGRFYDSPELIRECARKYGIYLLIILSGGKRQDALENTEEVARAYADEPMVLGYDIANEPFIEAVAGLKFDGEKSPVMKLRPYERYSAKLDKPVGIEGEEARELAAFATLWKKATDHLTQGSNSTFPGLGGPFNVPAEWRELANATDETLGIWLGRHIEAIRKYDKTHLITVGYNRVLECLPANRPLDFVSHHVYDRPSSYEKVVSNITTLDRIAKIWPDRPITLGEFGYSNGIVMPDGKFLDFHTSAVGEMIHYLYALTHGYDGAMKWTLADWHWDVIAKAGEKGRATQIYEAFFGMYYYDGNPHGLGRPKPICHSMKFLREYVDQNGPGGTLDIKRAQTSIGAGYVYRAKNALFVGDSAFQSPELEFHSAKPANVMLTWNKDSIKVMSTSDTVVRIDRARLVRGSSAGRLRLPLLEGKTIRIPAR